MHRTLSDEAIAALVDQASLMTSPMSAVVVEYYAGAAGRVGEHGDGVPAPTGSVGYRRRRTLDQCH